MKSKIEEAKSYRSLGYNCAQAVLLPFVDELGLEKEAAAKISCGFGSGMGTLQKTCGALTGAFMALGLKHGMGNSKEQEKKTEVYDLVKKFSQEFEKHHGALDCMELIGHNISTPEGRVKAKEEGVFDTKCAVFIEKAVEMLKEYI